MEQLEPPKIDREGWNRLHEYEEEVDDNSLLAAYFSRRTNMSVELFHVDDDNYTPLMHHCTFYVDLNMEGMGNECFTIKRTTSSDIPRTENMKEEVLEMMCIGESVSRVLSRGCK